MSFEIIRNNIVNVSADAIVNTANPYVTYGYGVDKAVYEAAGKERLLEERAKIGVMKPGDIAVTPAFDLRAKYIIHVIGPVWEEDDAGRVEVLTKCYREALLKAKELGCESIAFPLIASGTNGFPKTVALKVAVSEISDFLLENDMTVYLVVYDKESFIVSGKLFDDIKSYIDESDVLAPGKNFYSESRRISYRRFGVLPQCSSPIGEAYSGAAEPEEMMQMVTVGKKQSIDDVIREQKEDTFQQYLFRLIDQKGLDDTEVYKRANIDRRHFSKIRSNVDYKPTKKTALALAIALELSLDETRALLRRTGLALSHSDLFDLIVEYCIVNKIYDIYDINCILFSYDQPILGA